MKANNMKLKYIIMAASAAVLSASCSFLDLSDPNAVTVGNYYQNEDDIAQSVNGVYAALFGGSVLGTNSIYYEDCKARHVIYPDVGVGGGENASFDNCTVKPSSSNVLSRWNDTYKCIDRVNVVLKHLNDVTYSSEAVKSRLEAEVRFARAYCYYILVTSFGDVPLILEKLGTLEAVNAANVRVSKDKVYDAIFTDCKFAAESSLPNLQDGTNCGRASKAAAYTLWGKAALQMATDEDFASRKSELCGVAKTALEKAWGMKPFTDFKALAIEDAFDVATQETAKENIFQISYITGNSAASTSLCSMFRPSAIDDKAYETNGKSSAGSFFMPLKTAQRIWDEPGDYRFEKMMAHGFHQGIETYYPLKYRDLDASGYYGCNLVVLRYADVALMLAEANYHGGGSEALTWLNMVRNRAGLANSNATGTALRDAIYKEREREFAYEFKGWSDRRRAYTRDELERFMKDVENATEYSDTDYYLPIPHTQHILNPEGLWQNPGY